METARRLCLCWLLLAPGILSAQSPHPAAANTPTSDPALQLFQLANQARAAAGLGSLQWDDALAKAAREHCLRMSREVPLEHRYAGEPDLTSRTAAAGAHFSVIEENIAVGANSAEIHHGWLNSPEHRQNLLNPSVDRVGIAVVASHGLLFAVADYARAVAALTQPQVEAAIAKLLRAHHLEVMRGTRDARAYCASNGKYQGNNPPRLLMRWQNPDISHLPDQLIAALAGSDYHTVAVGSCPAQQVNGPFTTYRVAVLLY